MATTRRAGATPPSNSVASAPGYAEAAEMDKYRLVSNIGKGSFGVISKVQRVEDNKDFALKQLDYGKMTERDRKQILAEVAILESLKHRNIVQLVQKIKDPMNERIFIVMEYCTSGDLGSLIRKAQRSNTPLNEDKIWNIFLQITLALHHCHWPNERPRAAAANARSEGASARTQVLHRDLKPENVFLSGDFVKLGDFGLSKDMAGCAFTSTYVGTPLYMPPEILAENRYDTKSDIWSLGCLVFEMCALNSPFSTAKTQEELISMVKSGKLPPLPSHISPSLKAVIRAMLNLNPVRRPSTKDLLEMDEMKLHRKLFMVQNQTSLLTVRKEELQQYEARLQERTTSVEKRIAEMSEREAALAEREAGLNSREAELNDRENVIRENHRRISQAAEALRTQWDKFREEKDQQQHAKEAEDFVTSPEAMPEPAPPPPQATRPPLDERKTLPVPLSSRTLQRHPSYDDTPSKIPFPAAFSSPVPLDQRLANKISGLPSRRGSNAGMGVGNLQRRLASKSMTNLAARARSDDEYVAPLQSTPAKNRGQPGTPYRHVAGRTSIGSPSELERVFAEDVTMATASFVSPAPSMLPTPFAARPRKFSEDVEVSPYLPPTQIPAPTFVYRPEATPAKWTQDDPDLPSPFIRRMIPAMLNLAGGGGSGSSCSSGSSSAAASTTKAPSCLERAPLGSINPQQGAGGSGTASGLPNGANGGSVRKIPRSRSNTSLHAKVLQQNATRTAEPAAVVAPAPNGSSMATGPPVPGGLGSGSAIRTRPVVGRDPSRC